MFRLTLVAGRSKPAQIAVALFAWQCGSPDVYAFSLQPTVLVVRALVPVLASRPVIVFITFAFCGEIFAMARARLSELFTGFDVNIGT